MWRRHGTAALASVILLFLPATAGAQVRLPHVFGDHMVLQQGKALPVWGWAEPGEEVEVELAGARARAVANEQGQWMVVLPAREAGGPFEMTVTGRDRLVLSDVLVGEVWLCSGQSNMEMGLGVVEGGAEEAARADLPGLRLLAISRNPAGQPRENVDASWLVCTPQSVVDGTWGGFTAAGYFFGKVLLEELEVPVGLIESSWGGTRIEPWTPPEGFAATPALVGLAEEVRHKNREYQEGLPPKLDEMERWIASTRSALEQDGRLPPPLAWPHHPLAAADQPSGLYNGMIHPLVPYAIRGAIWYQGESNVHTRDGMAYLDKMRALIGGWRQAWGQGEFPFYYVQIAPFMYHWHKPDLEPDQVPRLWQAQLAALSIPNTGMVVTTDIANLRDIHPANKRDVGRRLALWALARTYGHEGIVYSGPLYRSLAIEGSVASISFEHVGAGLATRDEKPLDWFQIAGEDRVFHPAQARADGSTVLVTSDAVPRPVAVRFGWHQEAEPNLINSAGLPASPFRTDDW